MTEDTDYVLGHDQRHYQQLIEQDEILGPSTERMLRAAGIHEGCACLMLAAAWAMSPFC